MEMFSDVALRLSLLFVMPRFGVMTTVSPVQQEMEQRTREKKDIRQCTEYMGPVFGKEEKPENRQKGTGENYS